MFVRAYALAVAQLLDPSGELFGQRIISKGDDGSMLTNQSKRLMQVPLHSVSRSNIHTLSSHLGLRCLKLSSESSRNS